MFWNEISADSVESKLNRFPIAEMEFAIACVRLNWQAIFAKLLSITMAGLNDQRKFISHVRTKFRHDCK